MRTTTVGFGATMIALCLLPLASPADANQVTVRGEEILHNGKPVKLIGLRRSNALISEKTTSDLIGALDQYQSYGLNTVSAFVMGSRFGDVKGYLPDGSMSPVYRDRLERILKETQSRNMIVIVGCLYWGTSKAKEDLSGWTQEDANRAVANTARWLGEKAFTHVILDPDNEGMAVRQMKWQTEPTIRAAKDANPALLVANNTRKRSSSEDLNMHFGPKKEGKPWLDSESTPKRVPLSGYWSAFSKQAHMADKTFWNYSRIGRYTEEMKQSQFEITRDLLANHSVIVFASTWLQCPPNEGVNGPFAHPGGSSKIGSGEDRSAPWNTNIDTPHPDAGIRWWLEFVRDELK